MTWKALLAACVLSGSFALALPGVAEARGKARVEQGYPMKADDFRKLMEARIDKVRDAIDRKLDRHAVSSDRKKHIHKTIDEAAKDLRAAVDRAAADGTVTQAEADKVKAIAAHLRADVKERLAAEKSGKKLPEKKADKQAKAPPHGDKPVKPADKAVKPAKAQKPADKAVKPARTPKSSKPVVAAKKPAKAAKAKAKANKPKAAPPDEQTL